MRKVITIAENQELLLPVLWTGKEPDMKYTVHLAGKGASVTLLVLLLGKESSTIKLETNVYHQHPDTRSKIIVKGVLADRSSVDYDGLVKIEPGAKGTNTWLAAHLLLLSSQAKGRAVPSLEISENDIKAGHAATVGRVNDLEMFYLMSRGLSEKIAKQLIVQGFLQSILDDFPEDLTKNAQRYFKDI